MARVTGPLGLAMSLPDTSRTGSTPPAVLQVNTSSAAYRSKLVSCAWAQDTPMRSANSSTVARVIPCNMPLAGVNNWPFFTTKILLAAASAT